MNLEKIKIPQELHPSDPRFGVGPSLIPVKYLEKLAKTGTDLLGTSHRKPAVKKLVKELQENLREYFQVPSDYEIVIGNGGATFLWDMIGLGLVQKQSHHYVCGEFSQKWFKAHQKIPWIASEESRVDFGEGINPEYHQGCDLIACTLNETSTGVQLNQVPANDSSALMCMDATSGAGQIQVDLKKIDLYYFSPQKVLAGEGGLYFAFMSPAAIERSERIASEKRYIPVIMDWKLAIDNARSNQTYNTPSVSNLFLVNEQVKSMLDFGGQNSVCQEAERKAQFIYQWAENHPHLSPYVQNPEFRSRSVATINVSEQYQVSQMVQYLRDEKIIYDIDAYRKLGQNQFRISLFHNVSYENLQKLTQCIDYLLKNLSA